MTIDFFSLQGKMQLTGIILFIAGATFYWLSRRKDFPFNFGGSSTRILDMFTENVSAKATDGKIDPVIGREKEIMRVTQVLTRRTKNNAILVGPPGVGKTAIVEGLALRIATNDVPNVLQNKRVLALRVSELLAGTKYRGEFEERIKHLVEEIHKSNRSIILFIDEIHTVMQTKGTEGSVNLSDILKPALARGELQLIGATTQKEYKQYIQPDESWDRRFQCVLVDEPSIKESIEILHGIKKNYENFHQVRFDDKAIEAAVRLSEEYVKGRRLPDKAIDIIDEAAAMLNAEANPITDHAAALLHGAGKIMGSALPYIKSGKLKNLEKELKRLKNLEEKTKDNETLHTLRKEIIQTVREIEVEENRIATEDSDWPVVSEGHIKEVVSEWTGIKKSQIH